MENTKAFEKAVNNLYQYIQDHMIQCDRSRVSAVIALALPLNSNPHNGAMVGAFDEAKNVRVDFTRRLFKLFCLSLAMLEVPISGVIDEVKQAYNEIGEEEPS